MNNTFDHKRELKPISIKDVDESFFDWWDKKLNLAVKDGNDSTKKKVPVSFVAPERWSMARQEGVRDASGTIILPVIAISRVRIGGSNEEPFNRIVADTKQPFVYKRRLHPKSQLVKELIKNQGKNGREGWNVDPSLPIYEIFTSRVADHMVFQYEVSIWAQYHEQMNEIIERVNQEYDYLSVKSFAFDTKDKYYHVAFQDDELTDESNIEDYSDNERIIKRNYVFNVPAWIIPEPDDKKSSFKRFLSQSRLIFKNEVAMTKEQYEEFIGN